MFLPIMMKRNKILCLLVFLMYHFTLFSQSIEVHTINVGHGDASLIVVRDVALLKTRLQAAGHTLPTDELHLLDSAIEKGILLQNTVKKAVLVDAGDGNAQGDKIARYLEKMGIETRDSLTAFILTHNHKDHYGGFRALMAAGDYNTEIYYRGNAKPVADGPGFKNNFLSVSSKSGLPLHEVDITTTDLDLGTANGNPIKLTAVSSNGYVYKSKPPNNQINSNNQNDHGCSWILQYGAFRYFIGGDLSGANISSYKDMETPLVDSLVKYDKAVFTDYTNRTTPVRKGHICGFKVDHHGSRHSTNPWFLYNMSPKVAFISCGAQHGHPNVEVIDNFIDSLPYPSKTSTTANSLKNWYLTSLKSDWKDKRDSIGKTGNPGIISGNIVLVVDDKDISNKSRYVVQWDGENDADMVSKSKDMRKANLPGKTLYECHHANTINYFTP